MPKIWNTLITSFLLLLMAPLQGLESAKPWMGISIDHGKKGVLINAIIRNTPAERLGLKVGDEIFRVDGQAVQVPDQLSKLVHAKGVGSVLNLEFWRDGKQLKKQLTLEVQPDTLQMMRNLYVTQPAPAFEVKNLSDQTLIKSQDLKGRVVLLEFWATWCGTCRASIPRINELVKARKELLVLAVSEESEADIKEFLRKTPVAATVARDIKKQINLDYQVSSVPTFFLIDKRGVTRQVALGAGIYLEQLIKEIDLLLAEPS